MEVINYGLYINTIISTIFKIETRITTINTTVIITYTTIKIMDNIIYNTIVDRTLTIIPDETIT